MSTHTITDTMTPELDPDDYKIIWIAPLEIEAQAALRMLDNRHEGNFSVDRGNDYVFHAGDINGHNVVVATFPGGQQYGMASAAALASQIKTFFRNFWFALLVGIAAGLPDLSKAPPRDIRLGDVLVGLPNDTEPGVIPYELGRLTDEDFKILGGRILYTTEAIVKSAMSSIKIRRPNDHLVLLPYYEKIKDEEHSFEYPEGSEGKPTFADPGPEKDVLYDEFGKPTQRNRRPENKRTRVWYGTLGSGDKLMKNALKSRELRDKYNLIGLEMEAAGALTSIPVGVIRGVCDYGDRYKNKEWQPYAAAMASAYAKAVLCALGSGKHSKIVSRLTKFPSAVVRSGIPRDLNVLLLDSFYKQVQNTATPPKTTLEVDNEDEVSWITATTQYSSWLSSRGRLSRILWCQSKEEAPAFPVLESHLEQQDMSVLVHDCRESFPTSLNLSSDISQAIEALTNVRHDRVDFDSLIQIAVSQLFLDEQAIIPPSDQIGVFKSAKSMRNDKIFCILWALLIKSYVLTTPQLSSKSFGNYVINSVPDDGKVVEDKHAKVTDVLAKLLTKWMIKPVIILNHSDVLDKHDLNALNKVTTFLLQHSQSLQNSQHLRILLVSRLAKPGPLRDQALLVDQDTLYHQCAQTFYFPNMTQRRDHIATAYISTNHWIWSHPSYLSWANDPSVRALWIAGKPGSGKSVLARTLQKDITSKGSFKSAIVSAWFYSARDELSRHKDMLSGLLFQMLQGDKRVFKLILREYRWKLTLSMEAVHWSFTELKVLFKRVMLSQEVDLHFLFVLDGLDESSLHGVDDEGSRSTFLRFLMDLLDQCPPGRTKVILLSRMEHDIRSILWRLPSVMMHEANFGDIEQIINVGIEKILEELRDLKASDSESDSDKCLFLPAWKRPQSQAHSLFKQGQNAQTELIQHLKRHLIDNANGIILWVSSILSHMQMQIGSPFVTLSELIAEAKSLPTELSEVYITVLRSMTDNNKKVSNLSLAQRALLWVRMNQSPGKFYVQDLLEILSFDQDDLGGAWATVTSWSTFNKQLTRLCGPFIEIVTNKNGWQCDAYDPVQLLHHTVKTFLEDPTASAPLYLSEEDSTRQFHSDCELYIRRAFSETPPRSLDVCSGLFNTEKPLDELIGDIVMQLENKSLISYIHANNPTALDLIPAQFKELLRFLLISHPASRDQGLDSIQELFYRACKDGCANAIYTIFSLSSTWLLPWEWYLIEPEIISGALRAAKEFSTNESAQYLCYYASRRGILSDVLYDRRGPPSFEEILPEPSGTADEDIEMTDYEAVDFEAQYPDRMYQASEPEDPSFAETTQPGFEPAAAQRSKPLGPVRAVNEVLAFWIKLSQSPEFQSLHAFNGVAHLSDCPAVAWRMAVIRVTVLEDGMRDANGAKAQDGNTQVSAPWNSHCGLPPLIDGIRFSISSTTDTQSFTPLDGKSSFAEALRRLEEAPRGGGPSTFATFVWKENLRWAIQYEDHFEKAGQGELQYRYCFDELPTIPIELLRDIRPWDPLGDAQDWLSRSCQPWALL